MTHLQEALSELKASLAEMADLVSRQLDKSIRALVENDEDQANEVVISEKRVNAAELRIDEACEYIFALLNPVANDMRLVFATLKINSDLERIGDYAEGIAKLVLLGKHSFNPQLIKDLQVEEMYEIAHHMLTDVTTAYTHEDTKLARTIFSRDSHLDKINSQATDIITQFCHEQPDNIPQALHLLTIIRKLERAGDHMTNIAEEIIFYVEAKVLKHKKDENVRGNGS